MLKKCIIGKCKVNLIQKIQFFLQCIAKYRTKLAGMMDVLLWVEKNSQEVNTFGFFLKLQITKTIIGFKKEKLVDKIPKKYLTIENKYTNTFMNITITSGVLILYYFQSV